MATLRMPSRTDLAYYDMTVDLDGVTYAMTFRFNGRDGYWYMDIADIDGVPIRSGIRVVLGADFLRLLRDQRTPPGLMAALDGTGRGLEAGLEDLGRSVLLLYVESASLAEVGA